MTKPRLYYSHSKGIYGTEQEKEETFTIQRTFPKYVVVNPSNLQLDYRNYMTLAPLADPMQYFRGLVDGCKILVFTKWRGKIGAGVGTEINYALSQGIRVYKLEPHNHFKTYTIITKPVKHLTVEQTREMLARHNERKPTK